MRHTDGLSAAWAPIATVASQGASTSYADSDPARLGRADGFYRVGSPP